MLVLPLYCKIAPNEAFNAAIQNGILDRTIKTGSDYARASKLNLTNDLILENHHILTAAAKYGKPSLVEAVLKKNPEWVNDCDLSGLSAIFYAIYRTKTGHKKQDLESHKILELLVKHGASIHLPNSKGHTPLYCSVVSRIRSTTKFLIERGATLSPFPKGEDAKFYMEIFGKVKQINALPHPPSLFQLVAYERIDLLKKALKKHPYILDFSNSNGDTALSCVAKQVSKKSLAIAEFLIRQGAYINHKNLLGHTPLANSILAENKATAFLLLRNGGRIKVLFENMYFNHLYDELRLKITPNIPPHLLSTYGKQA